MLWNRSLVMIDEETGSLWSHLLGTAMAGPLKGNELEMLPSEMVTWKAWKQEHPGTTVLNMHRTYHGYVKEFYRRPDDFVLGTVLDGQSYAVPLPVLQKRPVLNLNLRNESLVVTFDGSSTAARLFSSEIDNHELTFQADGEGQMRDQETRTVWKTSTGEAVEGPLQGTMLEQRVGIMSYASTWKVFHPEARIIGEDANDAAP